jgi:protocatechuate 3,4-dioxygenase beta subunit
MNRRLTSDPPTWRFPSARCTRRDTLLGAAVYAAGGLTLAAAQAPGTCVLTPESGEGPFYFDPSLVRTDISDEQAGTPLEMRLQVVRVDDCAILENARVDVWQADALGLYSGYERQSGVGGVPTGPIIGKSFLRGTQFTDSDGRAGFRTIYPSWYRGRTPHIHFKVFLGDEEVVASQFFFADEINDWVFNEREPYRQHVGKRDTRNAEDTFLTDRVAGVFCDAERDGDRVRASLVIAVQRS